MAGGDSALGSAALDPNFLMRRLESIEQWQREMMPSVARTVSDMVAASVAFATEWAPASGFGVPSGGIGSEIVATVTVPRPTGYAYAGMIASGYIAAKNPTGGELILQAIIEINGSGAASSDVYVPAGATLPVTATRVYESSISGDVTFDLKVGSTSAWSSTPTNRAVLSAMVMFRRDAP